MTIARQTRANCRPLSSCLGEALRSCRQTKKTERQARAPGAPDDRQLSDESDETQLALNEQSATPRAYTVHPLVCVLPNYTLAL